MSESSVFCWNVSRWSKFLSHRLSYKSTNVRKLEVLGFIWSNYWTFLVENAQNVEDGNGKRKSSLRKRFFGNFQRLSETTEGGEDDNSSINEENSIEPKILSDEELLHKYWKLVVSSLLIKVHIFWEGHKILWNLHLTFVLCK